MVDAERALRSERGGLERVVAAFDCEIAVPSDEYGGQTDERVQHRDELGHPGHLDDAGPPEADRRTDHHRDDDEDQTCDVDLAVDGQRDGGHQGDGHAGHAVVVALLGRLMLGETSKREDEQQRSDEICRLGSGFDGQAVSSWRTWRAGGGLQRNRRTR